MRLSATQRAPRRVDKAANAPKFISTQNENTRLPAALEMRKLMPAKGLWNRFAMFRDVIEGVCASRNAIGETQAGLCLTNASQLETGN
jgi:hypothetical protein